MSERDFWRLTPAQFFELVEQANEDIRRDDLRFGYLISLVHNMVAKKAKEPSHWFPSLKPKPRVLSHKEEELKHRLAKAHLERGLMYGK